MNLIHFLKVDPQPFEDLWNRRKKAEIRRNDRNYQLGDEIAVKHPDGRAMWLKVTHIQKGYGIPNDYVVLSVDVVAAIQLETEATIAQLEKISEVA